MTRVRSNGCYPPCWRANRGHLCKGLISICVAYHIALIFRGSTNNLAIARARVLLNDYARRHACDEIVSQTIRYLMRPNSGRLSVDPDNWTRDPGTLPSLAWSDVNGSLYSSTLKKCRQNH